MSSIILYSWLHDRKKPLVKKLPEDTPLPDIIGKMLIDSGATTNKEANEKIAEYIISTCLQIAQDIRVTVDKVTRDIKEERSRWP